MNGTDIDTLSVDIFDGTSWHLDQFKIFGNQGNQWKKAIIYLTAFSDKTIKVRVNGRTGANFRGDIAIDDFGIDDHVSIKEEELNNSISIYPNPSNGEFNLVINNPSIDNAKIEIFDVYGRLIFIKNVTSKINSINLSEFSSGIYTVKISANNQISTKRIIKN
jgi:hypothetical protein